VWMLNSFGDNSLDFRLTLLSPWYIIDLLYNDRKVVSTQVQLLCLFYRASFSLNVFQVWMMESRTYSLM